MKKRTYLRNKSGMNFSAYQRKLLPFFLFFAFLFSSSVVWAQGHNIRGTVVEAGTGDPVIGASILEKGTGNGTLTDIEGNFSLTVSPGARIVVSYMGFTTKEVSVGNQSSLRIVLEEDGRSLDEVVVVGFGTQKKVNLTGAVGVARAEDLETRPVMELTQSLQGLVPGLEISKNNGSMEKSTTLRIRGVGTISTEVNASPLVLIDGMEGDINSVNPQDVESISVLKDAAAASIYGSRAPYGVILITTKSGKSGKTVVNYTNNFRWSAPTRVPKMMDSYTFAQYFNEAQRNTSASSGNQYIYSDETLQNMLDYQAGLISGPYMMPTSGNLWSDLPSGLSVGNTAYGNTDWYKEVYKDWAFSQEHNISAGGGNEKVTFYASFNYMDQSALLKVAEEGMQRYSVNGKFSAKLSDWATLTYSARFVRNDYTKPSQLNDGLYENLARQGRPNLSLYDNNGNLSNAFYYPKAFIEGGRYNKRYDNNYQQASLILEPIKNWITTGDLNYRIYDEMTYSYNLPIYNHDAYGDLVDTKPTSSVGNSFRKENYLNANLRSQYSFTLEEKHNFFVMGGVQIEEFKQKDNSLRAYGIINLSSPSVDATTGLDGDGNERAKEASGSTASWSTAGFFGRINYDYMSRYLFEVNLRYDGSSRYRSGHRWELYPSVSLGWNMAEESFMDKTRSVLDMAKLRASWGSLGSQNTNGWYPTYRTMDLNTKNSGKSGYWMQNGERPATSSIGRPITYDLTWETVSTWNIGLDWALFGNRLTGSFDAFIRNTENMIGPAQNLPAVYGQEVPQPNNTSLRTSGFELEIGWRDRLRNGLGYGVKLTLADAKTIVKKYPNVSNTLGEWWRVTASTGQWVDFREDFELGELWGYQTIGIARSQEEMDAHLDQLDANYRAYYGVDPEQPRMGQSKYGSNWGAGDIMYADLDGNGRIDSGASTLDDHGDIKVIGNMTPRYLFGIDLTADWKGFDVRAFFQGVMKRDFWTNSYMFWGSYATEAYSTGFVDHLDYFRADADHVFGQNLNGYYPRPSFDSDGTLGRNRQPQTRYLQNAAYIRLKNIQIGYSLPASLLSKIGFSQVRVYVSGENLWTGTKLMKMFDPETIDGGKGDDTDWRNINNGNAYPISKVISMGMSITL